MSNPKKLYRSIKNRIFAGVCAGLADYCSVDPNIMRIAFILLLFFGGLPLIVYLVIWLIVPEETDHWIE